MLDADEVDGRARRTSVVHHSNVTCCTTDTTETAAAGAGGGGDSVDHHTSLSRHESLSVDNKTLSWTSAEVMSWLERNRLQHLRDWYECLSAHDLSICTTCTNVLCSFEIVRAWFANFWSKPDSNCNSDPNLNLYPNSNPNLKPWLHVKQNYLSRWRSSEIISVTLNMLENIRELQRASEIILI